MKEKIEIKKTVIASLSIRVLELKQSLEEYTNERFRLEVMIARSNQELEKAKANETACSARLQEIQSHLNNLNHQEEVE